MAGMQCLASVHSACTLPVMERSVISAPLPSLPCSFALHLPANLPMDAAAPLLCAGKMAVQVEFEAGQEACLAAITGQQHDLHALCCAGQACTVQAGAPVLLRLLPS